MALISIPLEWTVIFQKIWRDFFFKHGANINSDSVVKWVDVKGDCDLMSLKDEESLI